MVFVGNKQIKGMFEAIYYYYQLSQLGDKTIVKKTKALWTTGDRTYGLSMSPPNACGDHISGLSTYGFNTSGQPTHGLKIIGLSTHGDRMNWNERIILIYTILILNNFNSYRPNIFWRVMYPNRWETDTRLRLNVMKKLY